MSARCLGRRPVHFARGDLRAARDRGRGVVRRSSVTRRRRRSAGKELASGFASGALGRVEPAEPARPEPGAWGAGSGAGARGAVVRSGP